METKQIENMKQCSISVSRTNLKTLKDFGGWDVEVGKDELGKHISLYELRLEAIGWIKELRIELETAKDLKLFENAQSDYVRMQILSVREEHPAQIKWIKHFFNITDEDLR